MASTFFDYKQGVLERYEKTSTENAINDLNTTDFYKFSFYNRSTAELDYKLLRLLVQVRDLPEAERKRAKFYLKEGAEFLLRDAKIADNSAEAKKYVDTIDEFNRVELAQDSAAARNVSLTEWQKAVKRFYTDLESLVATRNHVSKFITLLSYLNLYRLVTVFSKLSFKSFWNLAADWKWLDAQNNLFGYPIQRTALDLPTDFLNFLSVALFALRLAAHGAAIFKHARSQREGEKDIPVYDRIMREFSTRMINIMNDIAWVIINLLTNYAAYWGIADPLANTLLALTLAWDCTWLFIHWYRENRDWIKKEKELNEWESRASNSSEILLIKYQLQMVADIKLEMHAKYIFSIIAALSITTGYLIFLAQISALISTLCLVVCVIGFAMYGSADEFGSFIRARFGQMQIEGERAAMRAQFINTFFQTLLPPFIVVGLLSLGWQTAFLGAVGAVAYSYMPARWDCFTPAPPGEAVPPLAEARLLAN
ncbi:MAG: hypothetical protein ACO1N3_02580 [Gammaproteobacteria bacterium]